MHEKWINHGLQVCASSWLGVQQIEGNIQVIVRNEWQSFQFKLPFAQPDKGIDSL